MNKIFSRLKARKFPGIMMVSMAVVIMLSGCVQGAASQISTAPTPDQEVTQSPPEVSATEAPEATPEISAAVLPEVTAAPEVSGKADLNPGLSEFFLAKMKSNSDTNTFEGFTFESTIGDCLKKVEPDKLLFAVVTGNIKWLGYPAIIDCQFDGKKSGKLPLTRMGIIICPDTDESDKEISKKILAKLDKGLGSHKKESGRYIWQKGGLYTSFEPYSELYGFPYIMVIRIGDHGYPRTPSVFPFKIGADIYKVYDGLTPCVLPSGQGAQSNFLVWKDGDSEITVQFREDINGVIRLSSAYYLTHFDYMEPNECVGYLEWLADKLEGVMGKAKGRGYDIAEADKNGGIKWTGGGTGHDRSAQDVLDSGSKQFRFVVYWEGMNVLVEYGEHPSIRLYYGEDYLRNTVKK